MSTLRVGVSGAAGRMGLEVCSAVTDAEGMELVGRADPELGVALSEILPDCDVLVEFSTPDTVLQNSVEALRAGVHTVVGATGFDLADLQSAAEDSPANCFVAPNFAIGAVLMMVLSRQVAKFMPECEITEFHHDRKKDSPSGTAARTRDLIVEAGGNVHEPIHSVRLPGLVAHQEVLFGVEGQTLSIRHDSIDRRSFMPGVILAVRNVPELPERFTVGLENILDIG